MQVRVRPWITDLTITGGENHRVAYTVSGDKRSFTVKGTVTTDMPDKYSTCVFQSLTLPAGTYTLRDSVFSPSLPARTYVRIGYEGTSDDSQFTLEAGTYQLAFATRATDALDLTVTPVLTKLG